jgi:hypothetical protein
MHIGGGSTVVGIRQPQPSTSDFMTASSRYEGIEIAIVVSDVL